MLLVACDGFSDPPTDPRLLAQSDRAVLLNRATKALTLNDFDSLDALAERLLRFGDHYRQIAQPFDWTFTYADLDRVLARINAHETHAALAA